MGIEEIEEKLIHEVDWRTNEISIVKSIPFLYPFSNHQSSVLKKHTIPIFYSLWEGFVVESFSIYIREINSLKLTKDQLCTNLLVHGVDTKLNLRNPRIEFDKQISFIEDVIDFLLGEIEMPVVIPTGSNVNFKMINSLLRRFGLELLPEIPWKAQLNKLLFFRNKLSHGEYTIPIDQNIINEMSLIVIAAMHQVAEHITDGYRKNLHLKNT